MDAEAQAAKLVGMVSERLHSVCPPQSVHAFRDHADKNIISWISASSTQH